MTRNSSRRLLSLGATIGIASLVGSGLALVASQTAAAAEPAPTGTVWVSDLAWSTTSNGYGPVERDHSNGEAGTDGNALTIDGTVFAKGIGMHATGAIETGLGGNCTAFSATVGIDDEVKGTRGNIGSVEFQVWGDGALITKSAVVVNGDGGVALAADVTGVQTLRLVADQATNGKNYDHADWGDAQLVCNDTQPEVPQEPGIVDSWDLPGVDGSDISAELTLDEAGALALEVDRGGDEVISADSLGLEAEEGDFTSGLSVVDVKTATVSDSYTMVTGKQKDREYTFAETTFTVENADGEQLGLVVRLADDGAAYRYDLAGDIEHTVNDESGAWTFPADGPAWMETSYAHNYEAEWQQTTIANSNGTDSAGYPVLAMSGDSQVLLTEANVHGTYSATHLSHAPGKLSYGVDLFDNEPVTTTGAFSTPWRVAIVGDLGTLVESTLVDDLAAPSELEDTSWIKPGVSSWSWLTDSASPKNEARQRDFVDLAARNGWDYVLLDEGWDASWVPRTVRYANSKGVDVVVWFHHHDLLTQEQRDHWLPLLDEWGVKGVKVDFMDSDSQDIHQWYDDVARDTAAHHLMINFHGASLPTGLQRTWPNIVSYEAVRGEENGINATRNVILPFTRNIVGSMDFTPVVFSRGNDNSSKAQEVAMSIVYESGVQHYSDKPESYAANPEAETFLQNIPTTWDQTKLISGDPAKSVVLARNSGDNWYFGGMRAGSGPAVDVPLTVLGSGSWIVETLQDGATNADVVHTTQTVTSADTLSIPVNSNGGFGLIACPATEGRTTCYEAPQLVPDTTLTVTPATAVVPPATKKVDVSARFTSTVPLTGVTLAGSAPQGWSLEGSAATTGTLAAGTPLTVTYKAVVPADARGVVEIPFLASFTTEDGRELINTTQSALTVRATLTGTQYISDLDWQGELNGYGPVERDKSNGENGRDDGHTQKIKGVTYDKGVGMHATGELTTVLTGQCTVFEALVGIDDEVIENPTSPGTGSVKFQVYGDGELLGESAVVTNADGAVPLSVDITGVDELRLVADQSTNGKNFDHADWADAKVTCDEGSTPAPEVDRIAGADRFDVAVNASTVGFPDGASTVYVTSGEVFPDALSAAPAATIADAPILLTQGQSLPASVKTEITRLQPDHIVIVGGTNSVSPTVEKALKALAADVTRIGGSDRFEASRNVAEAAFPDGADVAVLATGMNFPDALSAGAAVGGHGPVILVNGDASSLDAATKSLLGSLGVDEIVIAGGPDSVSTGIESAAAAIADTVRLGGADRYAASRAINEHFFTEAGRVFLATGEKFPDALAGSALAPRFDAPLFTTQGACVPAETLAQITELGATKVTLLGGVNSLTGAVADLTACTEG